MGTDDGEEEIGSDEETADSKEYTDVESEDESMEKPKYLDMDKIINTDNETEEEEQEQENGQEKAELILEEELNEEIDKLENGKGSSTKKDPFSIHLDNELSPQHVQNLTSQPTEKKMLKLNWPQLGTLNVEIPKSCKENFTQNQQSQLKKKTLLSDCRTYASEGQAPTVLHCTIEELSLSAFKETLVTNIAFINSSNNSKTTENQLSEFQTELLSVINNYQDFYYSQRTYSNADDIRMIYCLHALNHMLKTRARIMHHNAKLSEANQKKLSIIPDSYQDQGLVRPKVLIVLPFRDSAFRVVSILIKLLYGHKAGKIKLEKSIFFN